MSLLKCPECNSNVSEYAEACPNCGCPINIIKEKQKNPNHLYTIINGKERDVTYYVNKIKDGSYDKDIQSMQKFYNEFRKEFNIQPFNFVKMVKESGTAPKEYTGEYSVLRKQPVAPTINLPHCPYCRSTNIKKISGTSRAASVIGFGILSKKIGKQWYCNNCKSYF